MDVGGRAQLQKQHTVLLLKLAFKLSGYVLEYWPLPPMFTSDPLTWWIFPGIPQFSLFICSSVLLFNTNWRYIWGEDWEQGYHECVKLKSRNNSAINVFFFCHGVVILYVTNKLQVTNRKDRSYSVVWSPDSFHFNSPSTATVKIIDTIQPVA